MCNSQKDNEIVQTLSQNISQKVVNTLLKWFKEDATENLIDTAAFGIGQISGSEDLQDKVGDFIAKEPLTKDGMGAKLNSILNWTTPHGQATKLLIGDNTEENSVLGDKADGLTQSAAHLAGSKALSMVGIPAELTMGVNAFGSEIENAYKNGASHAEALVSGAVAVCAEILFEKLSGGIKFGGKTLDEGATKALSRNLSNRIIRSILKWTGNTLLEGGEGYLTDATTNVVRKLTYADDKTWKEIFWSEEALDSFIGEMIIGGGFSGYDAVNSHVNGRDYAAGLTANEEKLVRQEYEKHIAEAMEKGQKLSAADKNKIWEAAVEEILGNQAAISEIGKSGWDGRVAVEPATGPKVTVGGKTYELIGYDKDGAKVYQDAEVVKEQNVSTKGESGTYAVDKNAEELLENPEKDSTITSKLTVADVKTVQDYMSAQSYMINGKLRTEMPLTEEEMALVSRFNETLDKMPVYRGDLQRSLFFEDAADVQEFLIDYTPGETIKYSEFISTTKGINQYNPDGQVQILIRDSQNGRDISSINDSEQEVVYKTDSEFVVINVIERNGKYYIILEESNYE